MQNTADFLHLSSRLFLNGISVDLLPSLTADRDMGRHFTGVSQPVSEALRDEWAADHFHLFGMNVYPNAAMYLDSGGVLGGSVNAAVLAAYDQIGFSSFPEAEGADHIGSELAFLAHILNLREKFRSGSASTDQVAAGLLGNHLLWWLPVFAHAVIRQGHPVYTDAVRLIQAKVFETANELSVSPGQPENVREPENLLADPETRLKDIARYLLTPVYSGMLLTRDRIAAAGRAFRLPRGFGDRLQIMHNLLRTAVDYELVPDLLGAFETETNAWQTHYESLSQTYPDFSPVADFWLRRLASSRRLLQEIRVEIA